LPSPSSRRNAVTKRGKPLARIVPSGRGETVYQQDSLAGTVTIVGDVMSPVLPPSAWDAFRDEFLPSGRPAGGPSDAAPD
jgi:antitoxin (DNA-binding transcriptional repressor) of toxin-antitoxin stability system